MKHEINSVPSEEFAFDNLPVRTITKDGEPWFVAKDVCEVLEIGNTSHALARLDDDEKGIAISDTLGGQQELLIINESGLYSLILRSRKRQAKAFKKWITGEVLPSIRRRGMYVVGQQKIRAELVDALAETIRTQALPALREYDRLTEHLHWRAFNRPSEYLREQEAAVDAVALQFDLPKSVVKALTSRGVAAVTGTFTEEIGGKR